MARRLPASAAATSRQLAVTARCTMSSVLGPGVGTMASQSSVKAASTAQSMCKGRSVAGGGKGSLRPEAQAAQQGFAGSHPAGPPGSLRDGLIRREQSRLVAVGGGALEEFGRDALARQQRA